MGRGRLRQMCIRDSYYSAAYGGAVLERSLKKAIVDVYKRQAHFCSMCGPKFCSMKISHDIREEAERIAGLETQKALFKETGNQLYMPVAATAFENSEVG